MLRMSLVRALHAETLKMKRTIALKIVILAPLTIVLLTVFMTSQIPFATLHRSTASDDWRAFARVNFQFWGLIMLPLYITLQTALIAGLDHSENQWKALFARPIPRWTIYLAKLLVVMAMTAASAFLLLCGILLAGGALHLITSEVRFGSSIPFAAMFQQAAEMTGLAFLSLTIQHWVSLRWHAFSVSVGFGIVAMVTGFTMLFTSGQYGGWPEYFPWSLPMLVLAKHPPDIVAALWGSVAIGIVVAVIGCVDLCRREVA